MTAGRDRRPLDEPRPAGSSWHGVRYREFNPGGLPGPPTMPGRDEPPRMRDRKEPWAARMPYGGWPRRPGQEHGDGEPRGGGVLVRGRRGRAGTGSERQGHGCPLSPTAQRFRPTEAFYHARRGSRAGALRRRRGCPTAWQPGAIEGRWTNRGGRAGAIEAPPDGPRSGHDGCSLGDFYPRGPSSGHTSTGPTPGASSGTPPPVFPSVGGGSRRYLADTCDHLGRCA